MIEVDKLLTMIGGPWFIQKDWVNDLLIKVAAFKGNVDFKEALNYFEVKAEDYQPQLYSTEVSRKGNPEQKLSIAVISVEGPVFRQKTERLTESVRGVKADASVGGLILKINSPGGHAQGIQDFLSEVKSFGKPVIAFVNDGLMCSGSYWLGCFANEIYASTKISCVGSVGAYTGITETKLLLEKIGITTKEVYAPQSTEKNLEWRELQVGNEEPLKERLRFLTNIFIEDVKTARNGKLNFSKGDPFKGADYFAETATAIGLIDGMKTFQGTLDRMDELMTKNSNNNTSMSLLKGYPTAVKALEKNESPTAEQITAANKQLTDDGITAVELVSVAAAKKSGEDLKTANDQVTELTKERDTLKTQVGEKEKAVETLTSENEALKAEVKTLGAKAAGTHTTVRTDGDETHQEGGEKGGFKLDAANASVANSLM